MGHRAGRGEGPHLAGLQVGQCAPPLLLLRVLRLCAVRELPLHAAAAVCAAARGKHSAPVRAGSVQRGMRSLRMLLWASPCEGVAERAWTCPCSGCGLYCFDAVLQGLELVHVGGAFTARVVFLLSLFFSREAPKQAPKQWSHPA